MKTLSACFVAFLMAIAILWGQSVPMNNPFVLSMSDNKLRIPSSLAVNIKKGIAIIHLEINEQGKLNNWAIAKLNIAADNAKIKYFRGGLLTEPTKEYPVEVSKYIPLIRMRLRELKIVRNRYDKPKPINYYVFTFQLVSK